MTEITTKYRIHSLDEFGKDVWWSNVDGWVEENYTLFTKKEKESFLYLPKNLTDSYWQIEKTGRP